MNRLALPLGLSLAGAFLLSAAAVPAPGEDERVLRQLRSDVGFLAADAQEGRGIGTKGLARAAEFLEQRMRTIGLRPAFGASFRQEFSVKTGVSLGAGNRLLGLPASDWAPLGFSSSGAFAGELVFVGYGIEAPALSYRELLGVDLRGKVALMLRYEPQEKDEKSVFDGRKPSRFSSLRHRVLQARERGAVAVVFVTGPLQDEGSDKVPPLRNDGPESPAGLPVLQVKTSVAERWLAPAGIDLAAFQKAVDQDLKPRSQATGVRIECEVDVVASFEKAQNVAGLIPGSGPLAAEVVVVGAHYDHLGMGGRGSTKPNVSAVHNGADDNASGTASALAIAERLHGALRGVGNRRTVLFALFAAEELGLGGSGYFVGHPPLPVERMAAMINLDMVGSLREDKLIVFGSASAPEWASAITRAAAGQKLRVVSSGDGYGPSDQTSFYAARVPVLHLFTGVHERYHSPEDDAETLDYPGMVRVIGFGTALARDLAGAKLTPHYARAATEPAAEGDSRGYGAYLGTVPDFGAMESASGGVKLSDVRPGSPAEKAGIRGGDTVVEMAGTRILNLYDMTYALQDHKPGETIDVVVLRDGQRLTLRATLGTRAGGAPSGPPGLTTITAGKPFETVFEGERHLADVRQLTFGGENAEAYWSPDGRTLVYQSHVDLASCDQQYVLDLTTGESRRVSSGKGRTTCGYFSYPRGDRIIYSSTESGGAACPATPDRSAGYTWPVYPSYDLWQVDADGGNRRLLDATPGYDGGAFYSPDCSEIVWRAYYPTGEKLDEYRALVARNLVRPSRMELMLANADGSNARQITNNGAANFCPYFTPDGKRIIFASNMGDPKRREFDLYLVSKKGGEPERVTYAPGFDGFPMWSPDGRWLVWGSNRSNPQGFVTNLFLARWVE